MGLSVFVKMDEALKNKIEAVLFSIGKKINIEEILRMTKEKDKGSAVACLIELKKKYNDDENNSLMVLQDGDNWKLTIKDQYIDVAKEMGIETELSKTVMETLAVIAYKNPVLQSEVIKIRTNKAYDHLRDLEELGYIQRERYGRTRKIKLTQKFFDYFDLPPDSLKEKFGNVEEMEKVIEDKEHQIHEIKEKKKEMLDEQKREEVEMEKRNIFMESKESDVKEVVEHDGHGMDVIKGERYGELEIVDEPNIEGEENDEKEVDEEKQKELEEKEMLGETGEKVGKLEVYKEPDNYIEPGIENVNVEGRKPALAEDDGEFEEANIESIQDKDKEKEEDIDKVQELKDKINDDEVERDVKEEKEDEEVVEKKVEHPKEEKNVEKSEVEDSPKKEDEEKEVSEKVESNNTRIGEAGEVAVVQNSDEEDEIKSRSIKEEALEEFGNKEIPEDDEEDEDSDEETKKKGMKENEFFEMKGIPKDIMEKVEEKAEEIMGENGKKGREDSE